MTCYIVRDLVDGALLPLRSLLKRLAIPEMAFWVFRNARLHVVSLADLPFGMRAPEFERLTREPSGFRVTSDEFDAFLKLDVQLVDGVIEASSASDPRQRALTIECDDASQWVISTDSPDLVLALKKSGFEPCGLP